MSRAIPTSTGPLGTAEHRFVLDRALASFRAADVSWLGVDGRSDRWALPADGLALLTTLVMVLAPRHVLEFGSGESTRVLARACLELALPSVVTVVEHDPRFAAATTRRLEADGTLDVVSLQVAPLVARRRFGALVPVYRWDRTRFAMAQPVDLVLIDGPPRVLGGREGTLYQALEVSRPGTIVLLDDAGRADELAVLERWERGLGRAIEIRRLPEFERGMAALIVNALKPLTGRRPHGATGRFAANDRKETGT